MTVTIKVGDALEQLATLPDESVHCVVTSPPYWGLRDYGMGGQIGLEATPQAFVDKLVAVFREVRRVLRADGTCWVNMGDSYAANRSYQVPDNKVGDVGNRKGMTASRRRDDAMIPRSDLRVEGLKPKDLVGMPWRLAFALQADGWWLRQDIIWHKPNPMPESVRDRCTKAHEYVFLLTKSERYWYDAEAISEQSSGNTNQRRPTGWADEGKKSARQWATEQRQGRKHLDAYEAGDERHRTKAGLVDYATKVRKLAEPGSGIKNTGSFDQAMSVMPERRNKRSVWTITTKGFSEAHFATFPPELPETCIKAGCPERGTVLDPFFGAGTTGLVADRLGRDCIGIELNPDYADMARRRIHADAPLLADVSAGA